MGTVPQPVSLGITLAEITNLQRKPRSCPAGLVLEAVSSWSKHTSRAVPQYPQPAQEAPHLSANFSQVLVAITSLKMHLLPQDRLEVKNNS